LPIPRPDADFLALLNKYRGAIQRVSRMYALNGSDREDLVQEIVYQLWRSFPSFRREAVPMTWVYRIALNTAITGLRRRSRQPVHVPIDAAVGVPSQSASAGFDSRIDLLYRAISSLRDVDRALVMCYLDGLSLLADRGRARLVGNQCWRAPGPRKSPVAGSGQRSGVGQMNLEAIERCWRDETNAQWPQLDEGTVMQILTRREADLRRDVKRRLRREAGYYLPIMAISIGSFLGGFTVNRILGAAAIVIMVGGVVATLWSAERRLEATRLDRSLREALTDLRQKVDAAGRAYVGVYVALFVVSAIILLGLVGRRYGVGQLFAGGVVLAALAVLWSYQSGRGYVGRMFRPYQVELAECLRQLED